jgi:hypothetical protein
VELLPVDWMLEVDCLQWERLANCIMQQARHSGRPSAGVSSNPVTDTKFTSEKTLNLVICGLHRVYRTSCQMGQ